MPKTEKIRRLFDNIAPDYDKLNHILSLDIDKIWRRKAVREMVCGEGALAVLDVACGTGDFSIETARKAAPGSHVTGIDLSEGMMKIGEEKIRKAGLSEIIDFQQGDCEKLLFVDGTFDRVSVAFGVRNFEHLDLGLREMLRVLRPGGKVVILELSVPSNKLLLTLYKLYFLHILPAVGGLISGDKAAYRYLPASVLKFPKPELFIPLMASCGYSDVKHRSFTFGICRLYTGVKSGAPASESNQNR